MGGVFCMELPKNITQIGEADKHCKIYVEDYVVSYIKQMNGMAQNKDIAIALYGRKTTEGGVSYLFAYGSAKLNFLQKPVRHLSQAQEQEIEKLRKKYFPEMTFLGYQILNGEMVEGFQICEQEICRYVAGYAQFYEKNDSMLAYMLENRGEEAEPEKVDQEKYEVVKKRQEERRQRQEKVSKERAATAQVRHEADNMVPVSTLGLRRMKMAAAGVFVLLCVMALALMRQESTGESLGQTARQAMSNLMEQKLPDAVEEQGQVSTLVAENKLEDALRQENAVAGSSEESTAEVPVDNSVAENTTAMTEGAEQNTTSDATPATEVPATEVPATEAPATETPVTEAPASETTAEITVTETVVEPKTYMIQRGDTLIGISMRNYGSNGRVAEICSLNGITDPDDIKIGQKILLP